MGYFLAITLLMTPTYALRFGLWGLSANLLMAWVFFLWAIFAADLTLKKSWNCFAAFIKTIDKKILVLTSLFFLAGLISLFAKGFDQKKLGQFIVLFLQPLSLFFIAGFTISQQPKVKNYLLSTIYCLLALMGLYAIVQYFTLLGLPPAWWGNSGEPRRALGFFGHPNFYALFSAPLLAFLLPDLGFRIKDLTKNWLSIIAWVIGAVGLFLSLSRAGWLGLAAAIAVYVLVAADKKIRKTTFAAAIVIAIVIISVPNLRWRFVLPFYGEKSAVSRLSLWTTGWKGIKEAPVTGLGLIGFARQWPTLNTDPGLADAAHNFPHNIFLDLWVETGLMGLISLIGLIGLLIYRGLRRFVIPSASEESLKQPLSAEKGSLHSSSLSLGLGRDDVIKLSISLFLIALLTQGLIDNPYFKNDLAMTFWIILALF